MDQAKAPCYDARALTRMYDHLTSVSRHMNALGWANYANDHEDANGQFEQNFRYADPLTTADRVIVFRYMVHSLAAEAGMLATFMPKPFSTPDRERPAHAPQPVGRATDSELFADADDGRGLGMSALGLLLHRRPARARRGPDRGRLPDGQLLQAAGQRAARTRVRPGRPAYATYGGNDRTHMLRVPDAGPGGGPLHRRLGQPVPGLSALIAAGLDGIERALDPGDPCELNLLKLDRGGGRRRSGCAPCP